MKEKLTLYQQLMLEEILINIGIQPYVVIASDNREVLNICINEIQKRIDAIELIYDYPHGAFDYTSPPWLTEKLTIEYKNIILMNFDKAIEDRMKHERYNDSTRFYHNNMYDCAVFEQMIGYREFLRNASIIVPCSNKLSGGYINDLRCFARIWHFDNLEMQRCRYGENEEEIKNKIDYLRKINHNEEYKERIEKRLMPYNGRK